MRKKIQLAFVGINGRMNKAVLQCLLNQKQFKQKYQIVAGVDEPTSPYVGKSLSSNPLFASMPQLGEVYVYDSLKRIKHPIDVVIDFSLPKATIATLATLKNINQDNSSNQNLAIGDRIKPAYLIGTTGFTVKEVNTIKKFSRYYPIVWSGNFSVGINVMLHLLQNLMRLNVVNDFDVEVNETHHRHKVDAPSGTAKMILNTIITERKTSDSQLIHDRHSVIGARKKNHIGVSSRRGGGVIGEHEVYLYGEHETITLKHTALDRLAFALGVVKAIDFLIDLRARKKTGLFGINEVLDLRDQKLPKKTK